MGQPSLSVQAELKQVLEQDQSKVGQVYRLTSKGLTPPQIAAELGVSTSGFVSNYRTVARAILEGFMPRGPSMAHQAASAVRRVVKLNDLSPEARGHLAEVISGLDQKASSGRPQQTPGPTLRERIDQELRLRVESLVARIKADTGIDADDYNSVRTASSPLDELAAHVLTRSAGRTCKALSCAHRLDLSLEAQSIEWAHDLPIRRDVVEGARGRLDYYRTQERSESDE